MNPAAHARIQLRTGVNALNLPRRNTEMTRSITGLLSARIQCRLTVPDSTARPYPAWGSCFSLDFPCARLSASHQLKKTLGFFDSHDKLDAYPTIKTTVQLPGSELALFSSLSVSPTVRGSCGPSVRGGNTRIGESKHHEGIGEIMEIPSACLNDNHFSCVSLRGANCDLF